MRRERLDYSMIERGTESNNHSFCLNRLMFEQRCVNFIILDYREIKIVSFTAAGRKFQREMEG